MRLTDELNVTQVLAGTLAVPVPGTSDSIEVVKYGLAKPPSFAALSSHVATSLWANACPVNVTVPTLAGAAAADVKVPAGTVVATLTAVNHTFFGVSRLRSAR